MNPITKKILINMAIHLYFAASLSILCASIAFPFCFMDKDFQYGWVGYIIYPLTLLTISTMDIIASKINNHF